MNRKEIYLVHQYLEKSHFKALYDHADKYGYSIKGFIVLDKIDIFRRFRNKIRDEKKIREAIKFFFYDMCNLIRIRFIKDRILIVGIAPYDKFLNKYYRCFMNNNSIYFTSWQSWDGSDFPRGSLKNKSRYEELMKKCFKGVACVSKLTEKSMKLYFNNTIVVNHAINIDEYQKKSIYLKNIKKYIYLGQLIERKNIKLLINWIKSNNEDFQFDFAGSGQLVDEVLKISQKDKRVNYLGKLSKDQIKVTLKNYDYLVLPSKDEPFGIVLLEALAAGVPCIVSNALGPKEIINDEYNGFIFDKEKEVSFQNVMNKSLNLESEKYIKMHENAMNSSRQYDGSNLIKNWIRVIEKGENKK